MATFLHNGPCPKCGSKDNLATYDDDSQWCWGCKYYKPPNISGFVAQQRKQEQQDDGEEETIKLPSDLTRDFSQEVVEFIKPYNLTIHELIHYDYYWSSYSRSLWRRLCDIHCSGIFVGAEGRRVLSEADRQSGKDGKSSYPKSLFRGSKENCYPIATPPSGTQCSSTSLVLVEDSLSSLKVGRVAHSLPLFGTSISVAKIEKLKRKLGYQSVVVWLDHDKFKEAWEIANKFKWLGVGANVVLTKLDPKYYSEQEIMEYIK